MLKDFIKGYWENLEIDERGKIMRLLGLADCLKVIPFETLPYVHRKAVTGYIVGELFDDIKDMIKLGWL